MEQSMNKTPIKWRASAIVLAVCLVLMQSLSSPFLHHI